MQPIEQLEQLGPHLGAVVANIRPEQLTAPTPCAELTVQGVLEHMIVGATAFATAFRDGVPAEPDLGDPLGSFGSALGDLVAAINEPGALDRTLTTPFGTMDGETFARYVALDGIVHGWDLATATGQRYEPPVELVATIDSFARGFLEPRRDGHTFADAVPPAAGASPIEQLANFTGRRS